MQQHLYMAQGIPLKPETARDMNVNSPGFSAAVGLVQHIEAWGAGNPNTDDADVAAQHQAPRLSSDERH